MLPFLLLSIAAAGCGGSEPDVAAAPSQEAGGGKKVFVGVSPVEAGPLSLEVALTGQLEAKYAVMVRSELEGVIRSIEFEEGQPVEEGAVLFRMRNAEQRARLAEAEAALRLAQDVYQRTESLTSRDISSIARRAEAGALLDEARAKVELEKVQLDRTEVRAPFDGVMGSLHVGPGEWVKPETDLVSIEAIDQLQLLIAIPEPSIALAKVGGRIHIRVVAYPDERFPGEIYFVSPSVDRATRRLIAKAWIPNADHRLKPGMFANVDVMVFQKESALTVPEAAVVYDRHGTFVWRVDEQDRARKVPVEMGIRQDGRVEILAGIAAGDRVVSAGVNKVMAGDRVEAVSARATGDGDEPGKEEEAPDAGSVHARERRGSGGGGVEG